MAMGRAAMGASKLTIFSYLENDGQVFETVAAVRVQMQ